MTEDRTENEDKIEELSFRESCQVVAVSAGFAVVFSFVCVLVFNASDLNSDLKAIRAAFAQGQLKLAFAMCLLPAAKFVDFPVGILGALFVVWQGAQCRRTALTTFLLNQMNEQKVREKYAQSRKEVERHGELPMIKQVSMTYLPPAVGWALFLGFALIVAGLLVWLTLRPG